MRDEANRAGCSFTNHESIDKHARCPLLKACSAQLYALILRRARVCGKRDRSRAQRRLSPPSRSVPSGQIAARVSRSAFASTSRLSTSKVGGRCLFNARGPQKRLCRSESARAAYDCWLREQRLRENAHRVGETILLQPIDATIIDECRCGATFEISEEETRRIVDFALFECANCSLQLKVGANFLFLAACLIRFAFRLLSIKLNKNFRANWKHAPSNILTVLLGKSRKFAKRLQSAIGLISFYAVALSRRGQKWHRKYASASGQCRRRD